MTDIVIESAKKPAELDGVYAKVKHEAAGYGFSTVAELKSAVVRQAMTDSKKPADFIVEVQTGDRHVVVQLVCDVKGKIHSVLGRAEIKSIDQLNKAVSLAKNQNLKNLF